MPMTFELVVRSAAGAIQTLTLSGPDAADARSRAVRDGFQVLACAPRTTVSTRHARNSAETGGRRRNTTKHGEKRENWDWNG